MSAERPLRCFVVPHTHWDREWYRPFEHFRLELARVIDELLDVLEGDPEFRSFTLDGQAIVLEDYLELRPENGERLRALLREGRIEVGPSYVLPDEFLVGAEPLVRNLLLGRAVCRRLGAEPSPVGYLPDSFGHPLQIPQLLAGFGIDTMIFSRGLGDELDELGVVFRWQGPDGSEVLAFQQLPSYGNFALVFEADEGEQRVRGIIDRFGPALERAGVAALLCNGSDHLPVTPQLPGLCRELEQRFPGSRFTIASYADYVRSLGAVMVPRHTGELLGSRIQNVLRGVNSARLYIKRANEQAEQRLLAAETLAGLRTLLDDSRFPGADFALAWRELLRCQPHDTICGCSCDEVHRDALVRYESLARTLSVLEGRSFQALGGSAAVGSGVGVVNPLPFRRRGLIEVPGAEPAVVELDGFSARTIEVGGADAGCGHAMAAGAGVAVAAGAVAAVTARATIENDRFHVEAIEDGTLTLFDKRHNRELRRLHALEDEADRGDLYNFCPVAAESAWRSNHASVRVLAAGPLVSELELVIEVQRPAGLDRDFRPLEKTAPLGVRTVVRLVQGSDRVEFRTTIENAVRDHRLRVVFPAGPADRLVRAEGQFAVVRRPPVPPRPRTGWAELPGRTQHTLGAVAVGPIALLTRGLPEYEVRPAGDHAELCLTLLRCVGIISQPEGVLGTRPHAAGPQLPTPEGQCLGRHECEYALLPDGGGLDDGALLRESQDYRSPWLTSAVQLEFDAPLALEGDVVFSCLKGAEDGDGLILRCFNPAASSAEVRVVGDVAVSQTRLDESVDRPLAEGVVRVGAFEVATFRLRPR